MAAQESVVATPQMWAFVEEQRGAAADGPERIAWENIAAILTHDGRFTRQLQLLHEIAQAELAVAEARERMGVAARAGYPQQVQAIWAANVTATEAFLARFPL